MDPAYRHSAEDLDFTPAGSSHSLLQHQENTVRDRRSPELDDQMARTAGMTRLGMFRAYWLGAVVCIGGFLCKYSSC